MPLNRLLLAVLLALGVDSATTLAGEPLADESKAAVDASAVPLNTFRFRSSYVFESDFDRGHDASGDVWGSSVEFGRRFPVALPWSPATDGAWFLRLGAEYNRFDFGHSGNLPLPDTLQSFAGVLALEYFVAGEVGILFETAPGFYFENDVRGESFDAPTKLAAAYRWNDRLIFIGGVTYSALRSYPVLPALGFLWRVNDRWTVRALVPEPRVIYRPSETLAFWAGAELAGGSFRTDREESRPGGLRDATLSYSEIRAGAGVTIGDPDRLALEVAGGYAFNRKFDYHRAEEVYNTADGAPFVKIGLRAAF